VNKTDPPQPGEVLDGNFPDCTRTASENASLLGRNLGAGVDAAALWLSVHREELTEPVSPAVRERFDLSILDAVDALQRAHLLRYRGLAQ
jgi:hypothetical protein